ncbi:MAG: hypothetical protein P0Y53_05645 [Candidatus Pseudobacter hemicellulosilyticus]|uniref:ASCH domain-containing protein n=1 Tax=Candidatus Pseudobacter hemicellulosilyticus TaxID=3121375 RepID=A0AAJ6BGR9_9BACT|nr:MAG: hypothetical protein P0Y53_05645 [Pseudobacter sp.]
MLFKQVHFNSVPSGAVTLAFRKWKQPAVNKGSLIRTDTGVIEIDSIEPVSIDQITVQDALAAGYAELPVLVQLLEKIPEGIIYRIQGHYHAAAEQPALSDADFEQIRQQLFQLELHSRQDNWTIATLMLIQEYPQLRAAELAEYTGRNQEWLKLQVGKLDKLGLISSQEEQYCLSPLGRLVLGRMLEEATGFLRSA